MRENHLMAASAGDQVGEWFMAKDLRYRHGSVGWGQSGRCGRDVGQGGMVRD